MNDADIITEMLILLDRLRCRYRMKWRSKECKAEYLDILNLLKQIEDRLYEIYQKVE